MRLSKNLAISQNGFLFNPVTGDSFSVNPVGHFMLMQLAEGIKKKALIEAICTRFSVEESIAERDIDDFLIILGQYQLLEGANK